MSMLLHDVLVQVRMVDEDFDWILTFKREPNWLGRLLGIKCSEIQYRGGSTVWHVYPSGERCDTGTEALLSRIITCEKWKLETTGSNNAHS